MGMTSLQEAHNQCVKIAQSYVSTMVKIPDKVPYPDKNLLGIALCLIDQKRIDNDLMPMSVDEIEAMKGQLFKVFDEARKFSLKHPGHGVVVISKTHRLIFYVENGKIDLNFIDRIALGAHPVNDGPKTKRGDNRTPEGEYKITSKYNGGIGFRYFMGINYPTPKQAKMGNTGGNVGIHGLSVEYAENVENSSTLEDWTLGCIALENYMARKYFETAKIGTPVLILH